MTKPIAFTKDNILYEGFRAYEGESDYHHPASLQGPRRYGLTVAICSVGTKTHSVWTVIDSQIFLNAFNKYIKDNYPDVTYTRFLRSRT